MNSCPRYLLVDDNAESRYLLGKTLLQKTPNAILLECQNAESAFELVGDDGLVAVISHRAADMEGIELIAQLRQRNPRVPLVMVSGRDRQADAIAAGADCFVPFEDWRRICDILRPMMGARRVS
jgi:CheY-like chemotaxis protein